MHILLKAIKTFDREDQSLDGLDSLLFQQESAQTATSWKGCSCI